MLRGCQRMERASVQRTALEVEELEVEGPLEHLELEERGRNISMRTPRCWALVRSTSGTVSDPFPVIIVRLCLRLLIPSVCK